VSLPNVRTNRALIWRTLDDYVDEYDLTDAQLDELIDAGDVEIRGDRGRFWARTTSGHALPTTAPTLATTGGSHLLPQRRL
jgi:hypothetical protein